MFDERSFIARVELADTEELASILTRPTVEEERALRAHLGDERYQRMHGLALRRNVTRSVRREPKGRVVVIHGIMGAELSVSSGGDGDLTWVNAFRIMRGWLERLRLSEDGRGDFNPKFKTRASGIMKRYYGEMLLSLGEGWDVRAFWFDWRKDLQLAADELNTQISGWFGDNSPVHIVAHSMGGLVARTFAKKYAARWDSMWDSQGKGASGGRLIMLGTPNHGSFAIPQVITGIEGLVRKLSRLDLVHFSLFHSSRALLDVFNSFAGSYQMLPSPLVMPTMEPLYKSATYGGYNVPQNHLTAARAHHDFLSDVVDEARMVYVAGFDQPTFNDIKTGPNAGTFLPLDDTDSYGVTLDGDGRVPHALGFLKGAGGRPIPTYFVREDHGNLSSSERVLKALDELLEKGETEDLYTDLASARAASRGAASALAAESPEQIRARMREEEEKDEERLSVSLRRMGSRGVATPDASASERPVGEGRADEELARRYSPEQRKVEETVTRGFLAYRGEGDDADDEPNGAGEEIESGRIEIGIFYGGIEKVHAQTLRGARGYPVDAIAVGHYIGVQPQAAEKAIDVAISRALLGREEDDQSPIAESDLLLTQYTERGIIHGKLGEPFFMPDPRRTGARPRRERLIVLAGMNEPGRFGVPELTVLARELCWSLGRADRRHLATLLIGTGNGNLSVQEAVSGWFDGIRRAVTGSEFDAGRRLRRVTFVEIDPRKIRTLQKLINDEARKQEKLGLKVDFVGYADEELDALREQELEWDRKDWERRHDDTRRGDDRAPTRVTLALDAARKIYRFGAITSDASVPEREIPIDPAVVMQANDELAAERGTKLQLERGRFLEGLLMPDDLRREIYNDAPLVMILDSTTARIHWEMVAQTSLAGGSANDGDFFGTSRGFTRQFRTTFAPPPEPPPPPRRVMRVLVVADPAEDAHLPGAQEEGVAVADLFESYNTVFRERAGETRVEVKRLFGPIEATRTNVLRELMVRQYDVLHFAGHCVYEWDGDPALSGWIFNAERREILSARELNRIDRVPKFVFSNACESGITPDRSGDRNVNLAPSFAEAFFARGVGNFVCTAWPVDDVAAREFAMTLYAGLLGFDDESVAEPGQRATASAGGPKRMHEAMRDARRAIARTSNGRTTWGAYQHYGNPYFQFFYAQRQDERPGSSSASGAERGGASDAGSRKGASAKRGGARAESTAKRSAGKKSVAKKSAGKKTARGRKG